MKLEKLDTESFEVEKFFTRIDQTLSSHYQKGWVDQISTDPSVHSYLLVMYQDMVDKSLDGTLCIYDPYCFTKKQFFLCHLILSEETTEHGRTPACIKKTIQALLKFLSTYTALFQFLNILYSKVNTFMNFLVMYLLSSLLSTSTYLVQNNKM